MKKTIITFGSLAVLATSLQAAVVFQDDFSTYSVGQNLASSGNWNQKWDGAGQQDLFLANGTGTAVFDLGVATNNFHSTAQTSFSLSAGDTAQVSIDLSITHNGAGIPLAVNKGFFGLGFATVAQWWQAGDRKDARVGNRNGAIGMPITVSPWVEGWLPWGDYGVNPTAGVDQVSAWITEELSISVSGGTYWTQAVIKNDLGGVVFTGTAIDTGVAAGTTIYATMTNGFVDTGTSTTEAITNIKSVEVDNFVLDVTVVPEPSAFAALFGLAALGMAIVRRRR